MKYRHLGKSGLQVSTLSFGAMTFGITQDNVFKIHMDRQDAKRMVDAALDIGINLFDTADMYANGQSEEILGFTLQGKRSDVLISTKAGFPVDLDNPLRRGLSRKHLMQQVETSLKRLGTDYIDIFICHIMDLMTPLEEVASTLQDIIQKGLVRYVGVSNFSAWQIQKLQDLMGSKYPLVVAQMHYSLLNRDIETNVIPCLQENNIGLMVWSPLSSGFLTGAYTRENPNPKGKRRSTFNMPAIHDLDLAYDVVEMLKDLANTYNTSVSSVAMAWLLHKKNTLFMAGHQDQYNVSTILIGANSLEQFQQNIQAQSLDLTSNDMNRLNDMTSPSLQYPEDFIKNFS